jgi:hypothetical protein
VRSANTHCLAFDDFGGASQRGASSLPW